MAVAQFLVAERTNHLRVTGVAAFTGIHVAAALLQRGVGTHALDLFNGFIDEEQRRDFHQTADADRQHGQHRHQANVGLNPFVFEVEVHCGFP